MKIVQFSRYGGPDVLEFVDAPEPVPGQHDIVVRAQAIGVGMPDILMRRGAYDWIPTLPVIPGNELAGVVNAVGSGTTAVKPGDRVYVNSRELSQRGGGYAEMVAVPAASVYLLPDGVSAEQAVTLGNYQLAWLLLNYASSPVAGDAILVHAAAGGAGSALVQMARRQGLIVYGIVGSPAKARYARADGATEVIDCSVGDVAGRIAALTSGAGVKFIYDGVGGSGFAGNFAMLAPMGTVVLFGDIGGLPAADVLTPMRSQFGRSLGLRLFSIHVLDGKPELRRHAMQQAIAAMETDEISPRIHARLPLAQVADAHSLLEARGTIGKIILVP